MRVMELPTIAVVEGEAETVKFPAVVVEELVLITQLPELELEVSVTEMREVIPPLEPVVNEIDDE